MVDFTILYVTSYGRVQTCTIIVKSAQGVESKIPNVHITTEFLQDMGQHLREP